MTIYIHTKFRDESQKVVGLMTGFYGMLKTAKRSESWNLFGIINQDSVACWCVFNNFNKITTQDEKVGGMLRPLNQMEAFKLDLNTNGLIDMG